jgi:excisionase family DNA binding protein
MMMVYTLKDVASILQCGYGLVYRMVRSGQLESFKVGNNYRVTAQQLEKYIKNSSEE